METFGILFLIMCIVYFRVFEPMNVVPVLPEERVGSPGAELRNFS